MALVAIGVLLSRPITTKTISRFKPSILSAFGPAFLVGILAPFMKLYPAVFLPISFPHVPPSKTALLFPFQLISKPPFILLPNDLIPPRMTNQ